MQTRYLICIFTEHMGKYDDIQYMKPLFAAYFEELKKSIDKKIGNNLPPIQEHTDQDAAIDWYKRFREGAISIANDYNYTKRFWQKKIEIDLPNEIVVVPITKIEENG